jgi:3-dehydrotetronate 4-kinase
MTVVLGAIADDFTGATDLASTWARQGLQVIQTIGVPDESTVGEGAEAIFVALKSRTAPKDEAVAESLAAYRWLKSIGAQQIVFKYCSTFDSTPMGNIGPVADALLEEAGETLTVVCPAFTANGRTVYQGHLFVGTQLMSDSPMRHHPLTPMGDSSLIRLMEAQTRHPVGLIPLTMVRSGAASVSKCIADLRAEGVVYAVTDALTDDDLLTIGLAIKDLALVTGGSGIGMGLPQNFRDQGLLARPATTWSGVWPSALRFSATVAPPPAPLRIPCVA